MLLSFNQIYIKMIQYPSLETVDLGCPSWFTHCFHSSTIQRGWRPPTSLEGRYSAQGYPESMSKICLIGSNTSMFQVPY